MLNIIVPAGESYDEKKNDFAKYQAVTKELKLRK